MPWTHESVADDPELSETKFRRYIDSAPDGVFVVDQTGRYVELNPAALRITGYSDAELRTMCISDLLPVQARDAGRVHFETLKATGESSGEMQFRRKDGTIGWWIVDAVRLSETRYLGFVRDTTERKQTEIALAARRRELEVLHRLSEIALRHRAIQLTLQEVTEAVAAATGFPVVTIEYYDEARQVMEFAAATGMTLPAECGALRVPASRSLSGLVAHSGRPLVETRAMDRSENGVEELRALGLQTFVCVPMTVGTGVIGTMSLASPEIAPLDDDVVPLASSLANFIASIIDRALAAEALRESEQSFRNQFANNTSVMLLIDYEDGTIVDANEAALRFYGYSQEQLLALKITDINTQQAARTKLDWRSVTLERGRMFEFQHRLADGSLREVEVSSTQVQLGKRRVLHSIISDVTDRKRAQEALRQSEDRFKQSMDAANDGIWDWNVATGAAYFSPGYARMLGYDPDTFVGQFRTWLELIHPDDRDRALRTNMDCVEGPKARFEVEFRMHASNGEWRWILARGKCLARDERGRALRMIGTHVDITDRKRAEDERERLQAQLLQSQKMESVGRLAGGVAHDFNNMLGVILGHTDMALEQVDPATPLHDDLTEVRSAAKRSADLTRQLLAFARKQTVSPKVLDLNQTVQGMLNMLQRLIGANIRLSWRPMADLWQLKVDPSQIDQILANLCLNARDAISQVGTITIETGNALVNDDDCAGHVDLTPGEYVMLSVRDDGVGMDNGTLAHIFEPFFTTKVLGAGTGLGLATVYGAVRQNRGAIEVRSQPGAGSTFTIYLPRHVGAADQASLESTRAQPPQGNEVVLLVEDEPGVRKMTARMLGRLGHTVLQAGTPAEAIRLAREHAGAINLLVTDVVLPEMNGLALAGQLLALCPNLKRLFMSGYTSDVMGDGGVLGDGAPFIQKPFSASDLAAKVREALKG